MNKNVEKILSIPYHELCAELFRRGDYRIQYTTPWGVHHKQKEALELLCQRPEVTRVGYGGGARCFIAGTLVLTKKGGIPIEYISIGDFVLSENEIGTLEYKKVLKTFSNTATSKRKFIKFVLKNNCEIKSTEQHEYRFNGNWIQGRDIARRVMALRGKHESALSSEQYGEIVNNWLQGKQKDFYYEASSRCIGIFEDNVENIGSVKNSEGPSNCSKSFYIKPKKSSSCQPYKLQKRRQPIGKFRMDDSKRKFNTFSHGGSNKYTNSFTSSAKGRGQYNFNTNRKTSERDTREIQAKEVHQRNARKRIWRKGQYNKRCSASQELEARELTLDEISRIEFTTEYLEVFDLHVEDNHNYVVSSEKIKVHNSGKSWVSGEWVVMSAIAYPGTGWGLAREELVTLRKTTWLTFEKVFQKYRLEVDKHYKINQRDNVVTFYNGSQIFLLDTSVKLDDPEYTRFGGLELTGLVLDESNESPYKAIEILSGRVGFRNNIKYNLPRKILEMFNPDKGHVHERFWIPFRQGTEPVNKKFIRALPSDNPDPAVAIWVNQYQEEASPLSIRRLIHGDFDYDDDSNRLITQDACNDYFINEHVKAEGRKYITADIARLGKDYTIIRVWHGLRCIERHQIYKSLVTDTAAKIKEIANYHQIPMSQVVVDEDGVGCLVKGTRVLTLNGWKFIEEIKKGDKVYSKDLNNNLIISSVIENIKREKTDIIEDASGVSFSFSHFLPTRTRLEYDFKMNSWDAVMDGGKKYFDSEFKWNGVDFNFTLPGTKYKMPNGGYKKINNELNIKSHLFATFLGWFISEGCIDGKYIRITQNKTSIHYSGILKTLKDCGFNVYEKLQSNKRAVDFIFSHKGLVKWLKKNCYTNTYYKSFNKKIPDIIKFAPKSVIDYFLWAYCNGDGTIHHGQREYFTGSPCLAYDVHELILKIGKQASLSVKQKKGSTSSINGRLITRNRDIYVITELKEKSVGIYPKIKRVYEDHVYNLEIDSPTKLYLVNFESLRRSFFIHNGGVKDILNCYGFVNNSKPLWTNANYGNLKAQCSFMMADLFNNQKVAEYCDNIDLKTRIKQEIDCVKQKNPDKDSQKLYVLSKDEVKGIIGRSPDDWDSIMMRAFFEIGK